MSRSRSKQTRRRNESDQFTVYHLAQRHEGLTLAAAVKDVCGSTSWGQAKKRIAKRQVQVNGNLCLDAARRVRSRDVIKVWTHSLAKPVETQDIRLAHLDEHLLVVNKPAGITSVRHFEERQLSPRRRQLQPTLEELLPPVLARVQKRRWPPLPPQGVSRGRRNARRPSHGHGGRPLSVDQLPPELRIFPVHRLDRDTSGLMVFARTKTAEKKLVELFRRHSVHREYVAFCLGDVPPQTIRSRLVRDRGDGRRGSLPPDSASNAGVPAVTHVLSSRSVVHLPSGQAVFDLRCRLETGRTHQIRIHLSEAGHPICGDKLYCRLQDGRLLQDDSGAPRQALHSDRLSFNHPVTGERLSFEMPLPKDLADWLRLLKSRAK